MPSSSEESTLARRPLGVALGLLLLAVLLFFWRVATFQGALFHYDLIGFNAPIRAFFFGQTAQGRFPLWCPDTCGGFPLFAEGQAGPLYPPNYALFTWLPAWAALNLSAILHVLLAALGMFFYLARGHRRASAAIGALSYCLSSYLVFHLIHLMLFQSACLAPWLFFFVDRWLDRRRVADLLGGALTLALMFAAGQQQGPILIGLGLAAFLTALAAEEAFAGRGRQAGAIVGAGAAVALLTAMMTSVIVWGLLDTLQRSVRQEAMPAAFLYSGSILPRMLVRLASPFHHGRWADDTWLLPDQTEKEIAVYLSLAAWLFAPLALAGGGRRRDRGHLAVVLFGLLFVLGAAGPFTGLWERLPPLNRMRTPARFALPTALSLSYLIASGLDNLTERRTSGRTACLLAAAGGLAWAALAWGGALADYGSAAWRGSLPGMEAHLAAAMDNLARDLRLRSALAAGMGLSAVGLWAARGRTRALFVLLIGLLAFADLSFVGRIENPTIDSTAYGPFTTVQFLRERGGAGRLYSTDRNLPYGHGNWANDLTSFLTGIKALPHDTPLLFGLKTASCNSSLLPARNARAQREARIEWLRQMGVRFILTRGRWAGTPTLDAGDVRVYELPAPLPLYSLTTDVRAVSDAGAAFAATLETAALPTPPAILEGEAPAGAATGLLNVSRITVSRDEPDRRLLSIEADQPAFLLVRENFDPAWRALVDGRETPTRRANYLHYGLFVPSGAHRVELQYRPSWFRPLMALSLASFFGALGAALFCRPFRRARSDALAEAPKRRTAVRALTAILLLFLLLLAIAMTRHPDLWRLTAIAAVFGG